MNGLGVIVGLAFAFLAMLIGVSAWAARQLPPSGPVPTHFDIRGRADGFGSRWITLGIMPASYAFDADPPVLPNADGEYPIAMPGQTKVL